MSFVLELNNFHRNSLGMVVVPSYATANNTESTLEETVIFTVNTSPYIVAMGKYIWQRNCLFWGLIYLCFREQPNPSDSCLCWWWASLSFLSMKSSFLPGWGLAPFDGSVGAAGSCQDTDTPSTENVKSRGTSLGWHPSGFHHACDAATVDGRAENCEMQKGIELFFFMFSWHLLLCKEGHNRERWVKLQYV